MKHNEQRRSSRVVAGVKSGARAIKEILLEKLGEKIFVDVEPFLKELHENGKQLRSLATHKYLKRMMGADFANRVLAFRGEVGIVRTDGNVGILEAIKQELRDTKKSGDEAEDPWRVWPEFVAWVKSNAMDSFDPERNPSWKHGNQVNNFLAIILPTQVERHSAIEFLTLFLGMEPVVEETKANVRAVLEDLDNFFFDREDYIKRKESNPPVAKEGVSNLERIAAKTRFQVELERDRRVVREARRCYVLLEPWLRGKEVEEDDGESKGSDEPSVDPATAKLFHALDLPDPDKYLARLEELLQEATKTGAPHLKAIGELTEAATELVPAARGAGVDVLGILKQAVTLAEKKDAKGMRAVTPGLRALYKLHASKSSKKAAVAR